MASKTSTRSSHLRRRVAHEAARLIVDSGMRDYAQAKRKAAGQLQAPGGALPRNEEIEAAVHEYQRLFRSERHSRSLDILRRTALEAMRFLVGFDPCLVGPVLRGTADYHTPVTLHVFSDPAEAVGLFLMDQGIPHELTQRRLRFSAAVTQDFPTYRFMADETAVELVVFPVNGRRQAPLSPIDGRPMQRAGIRACEAIVYAGGESHCGRS